MVNNNERSSSSQDYPEVVFLTSCVQGSKRIIIKDIVYIEAMKDNCMVYMSDQTRYHLTCPMKDIEDTLNPSTFMRIHRSFIVQSAKSVSSKKCCLRRLVNCLSQHPCTPCVVYSTIFKKNHNNQKRVCLQ